MYSDSELIGWDNDKVNNDSDETEFLGCIDRLSRCAENL